MQPPVLRGESDEEWRSYSIMLKEACDDGDVSLVTSLKQREERRKQLKSQRKFLRDLQKMREREEQLLQKRQLQQQQQQQRHPNQQQLEDESTARESAFDESTATLPNQRTNATSRAQNARIIPPREIFVKLLTI